MSAILGQVINVVFGDDNFSNNANSVKYTDNLVVTINGISNEPQKTDITVEQNNDGTYTLSLNKFILISGEDIMPVGNIVLENIVVTEENGIKSFAVERNIIKKSGSWFSYGETRLAQGRDAVKQLLLDNPELTEEIEARVMAEVEEEKQ
jgi:recombination protein RecA